MKSYIELFYPDQASVLGHKREGRGVFSNCNNRPKSRKSELLVTFAGLLLSFCPLDQLCSCCPLPVSWDPVFFQKSGLPIPPTLFDARIILLLWIKNFQIVYSLRYCFVWTAWVRIHLELLHSIFQVFPDIGIVVQPKQELLAETFHHNLHSSKHTVYRLATAAYGLRLAFRFPSQKQTES